MESIYGYEKEHLSFSCIRLWTTNKDAYRKKYYPKDGKGISTIYTRFGKKIADILEKRDYEQFPALKQIPYYSVSEHPLEVYIKGIKVVGYLDLFEPETYSIGEVKTGINNAWDKVKVRKWDQLPFYSLLVKTKYDRIDPITHLFWLETAFKEQQGMLRNKELQLTGRMEIFTRRISDAQRKRQRDIIIRSAAEIYEDFKNCQ